MWKSQLVTDWARQVVSHMVCKVINNSIISSFHGVASGCHCEGFSKSGLCVNNYIIYKGNTLAKVRAITALTTGEAWQGHCAMTLIHGEYGPKDDLALYTRKG